MVFFMQICIKEIFLLNENGDIAPVDFGIMGRLDNLNRRFLAEILIWLYSKRL